ncbi:MAG: heavy metal translocating P-type ATPase [Anaerolineales bacterium]|nr:heavy metal translocating P-type ATPase [Anaerolineales bacterium]
MNATCQIVHQSPGRIRLQVPGFKAQPQLGELLLAMILQQPGIVRVQFRPQTESVIIIFDQTRWTPTSLLLALQGNPPIVSSPQKANQPPPEAQPKAEIFPFKTCQLAHAIRGRVRLEAQNIGDDDLAHVLKSFLEQQPGIKRVRFNARAESVIVEYDAIIWDAKSLVTLIRAYNPQPDEFERASSVIKSKQAELSSRPKSEITLAAAALVLSLVGGPAAPLALGFLWFSTRSIFERARHMLLREHKLTVESLDAAAISVLVLQGMFWQVALLNLMLSTAKLIRAKTQEQARRELTDVLDFLTDNAWVKKDGLIISIPVAELSSGTVVYVFPGERIPADGIVLQGKALVDQHMLTGESMPIMKGLGDELFAATVVREGELQLRVTLTGEQTQAARIINLIENAPIFDTRAQDYAQRWANRLVPYSFLGAGILALTGNFAQAAALLVIDYAAGFKVSAPTTIMSAMTKAARYGIFIRGGRHLEQLAVVDAIVFDKTGTLTLGSPEIITINALAENWTEDDILIYAAAAEQCLTHPVAAAVMRTAVARNLPILQRDNFEYQIGQGVSALVNGQVVLVGSYRFLAVSGINFDAVAEHILQQTEARAASPLCIAVDGTLVGLLGLADPIRSEAADVMQTLHARGIRKIVMLTGDRSPVAESVACQLGIEEYVAEVFPADKLDTVQTLQAEGYVVAVIGDGINDSPALAQADVGLAVNGGTALAQETADVVFLQGNLYKLIEAIDIAREAMALVRQNWDIVRIPNTIGLGLAFTGFIGPLGASILSDGAALVAGGNALRPLMHKGQSQEETQ